MKMKNLLFLIPLLFVSLCLISCGDDDDKSNTNTNEGAMEMTDDYIATTSVKTAIIPYTDTGNIYNLVGIKIYEDYNHLYSLSMCAGRVIFVHYERTNGRWMSDVSDVHGIKDTGKVSSLQEVTDKDKGNDIAVSVDDRFLHYCCSTVQPNHGYAAYFTTEDGEVKYLRILVTDYSLDESGALETITVQYQLY